MLKHILLIFCLLFAIGKVSAQSNLIDSLQNVIETGSKKEIIGAEIKMAEILTDSSEFESAKELLEKNLESIFSLNDPLIKIPFHYTYGKLYSRTKKNDSAIYHYEICLPLSQENDQRAYYFQSVANLAHLYALKGQSAKSNSILIKAIKETTESDKQTTPSAIASLYKTRSFHFLRLGTHLDSARYFLDKSFPLYKKKGEFLQLTSSYINYGASYGIESKYDSCTKYLLIALHYADSLGFVNQQSSCLENLGSLYGIMLQYEKAYQIYKRSETIAFQQNGTTTRKASIYSSLSNVFFARDQYDSAYALLPKIKMLIGDSEPYTRANLYTSISKIYLKNEEYDSAQLYVNKASENNAIYNSLNPSNTAHFYTVKGQLDYNTGNIEEAIKSFNAVLSQGNGIIDQQAISHKYLSEIYENKQNFSKAFFHLKKSSLLSDSIHTTKTTIFINDAQTKYETEKKEAQNKLLRAQNAEQTVIAKSATLKKRAWSFAALGALLIALFSGLWFNQKKKANEQTLTMEKQKFSQQIEQQENKNLQAILDALEEERTRIAQDIHDRIGAGISTAKLYFEGMKELVGKGNKQVEENFKQVDALLASSISEVRKVSHNMVSGVLADFGLIPALRDLQETIQSSGKVSCNLDANLNGRLDKNIEINLYRIVQELISNSIKYANCSQIDISLKQSESSIVLDYQDNGIGFNPTDEQSGLGHKNIKARVDSLSGMYDNRSKPQKGSQYTFNIPL